MEQGGSIVCGSSSSAVKQWDSIVKEFWCCEAGGGIVKQF